jgi:hypothetical protein
MAPVDGSVGNAMVSLGCGITERRGAAVDSAVAVWGCTGYTGGGMKKGGELRFVASEGDTASCMLGTWRQQRHAAPASEVRWRGRDGAGSVRCRVARSRKTPGLSETDWVGTVALCRAQFGAQCCFAIIQTLLRFQNMK